MKRNPVLIYSAVVAALTAFLGVAGLTDRVPENVVFWLGVALAVLTAAGGVIVRGQVTPLAEPVAKDGTPLVPADDPAEVPLSPEAVERVRAALPHIKARTRTVEVRTPQDPPIPGQP